MNFKKRVRIRLYVALVYLALGLCLIFGAFIAKSENGFISAFGLALAVMGFARVRNYFLTTKSEEVLRKKEIAETDERNIQISQKAKSLAFVLYIIIVGIAVIVLSFLGIHEVAKWISLSVCLLILLYYVGYFIYQKKL